jgi:hypothetical protein
MFSFYPLIRSWERMSRAQTREAGSKDRKRLRDVHGGESISPVLTEPFGSPANLNPIHASPSPS